VLTGQSLTESDLARLNQGVTAVLEKGLFSEQEMLEHLSQSLLRVNRSRNTARQIVSLAMAYIHENYEDPLSRELIAGHVSVHVNYLTNCFTQVLGISPIIYLNRYRINQARKLLEAGELNITQIAMAVGFSDPAYFSRMFQREVGIAPGVYRRGQRP